MAENDQQGPPPEQPPPPPPRDPTIVDTRGDDPPPPRDPTMHVTGTDVDIRRPRRHKRDR